MLEVNAEQLSNYMGLSHGIGEGKKLFINASVFMDNDVLRLPEGEAGRTDDQSWVWMPSV